ncbi:MAG: CoA transferase, partial [Chloroflexi bacterium]|nr:CoA transferase [Chloroflexota bacterium]
RHFNEFNRNKRSVTLNMADPRGRELLARVVRVSDVLLDNYGPGILDRWGFGYEEARRLRPDLVVVNMPGMGLSGPQKGYVTWGPNIASVSGMTHLWGLPTYTEPVGSQSAHPDYIAGAHAAVAVMLALLQRADTGQGQQIEVAQLETAAAFLGPFYLDELVNGRHPLPQGNSHPAYAPYGCYRCAPRADPGPEDPLGGDDRWCFFSCTSDEEWESLCDAVEHPEWREDPRFADLVGRLRHRVELDALLGAWTRQRSPHEVMETLQARGVPAGAVQDGRDLYEDAHLRERGYQTEILHRLPGRPLTYPGLTAHLSRTPGAVVREAPELGEDNADIFGELLGLSAAEIAEMVGAGAIR